MVSGVFKQILPVHRRPRVGFVSLDVVMPHNSAKRCPLLVAEGSFDPRAVGFPRCRSASPPFQQPSSTSTVRRGGLSTASLSTSTTKSDAIDPGGSTNFP